MFHPVVDEMLLNAQNVAESESLPGGGLMPPQLRSAGDEYKCGQRHTALDDPRLAPPESCRYGWPTA